jgi:tetratricopeptide (TPR) repeat protein
VLEHEYVHTVTLDATGYRIAHWLTEGMAVWQEQAARDFETCQLLAAALHGDGLIELDWLNWAFVRPRSPHERPLAYAQSHWIIEYLVERFGVEVLARLLEASRAAMDDATMLTLATDLPAETLLGDFRVWATEQVARWGLDPASRGRLAALRAASQRAVDDGDVAAALAALAAYREVCPVDPWPHRMLLRLPDEAVTADARLTALRFIAERTLDDAGPAASLAQQHRQGGEMDAAGEAMAMAVFIEPYKPALREQAAAIALERGDRHLALEHVTALTLLEPDHAHHFVRLAALHALRDEPEQAADAARRARQLDPAAPVQRFLPLEQTR